MDEQSPNPHCYGCQGTGYIRWHGNINGKPCPCMDYDEDGEPKETVMSNNELKEVVEMSNKTLEWGSPLTSEQAKKYLLTRGFVSVELHDAEIQRLQSELEVERAKVRELERKLDKARGVYRTTNHG